MDIQAAQTAINRASKRYRHAVRMIEGAESERARARHARRIRQAQRLLGEARYDFEALAMETAD